MTASSTLSRPSKFRHILAIARKATATGLWIRSALVLLPLSDQIALARFLREVAPWMRGRGLITKEDYIEVMNFRPRRQESSLTRGHITTAISRVKVIAKPANRGQFMELRTNAIFACVVGLGMDSRSIANVTIGEMEDRVALTKSKWVPLILTPWLKFRRGSKKAMISLMFAVKHGQKTEVAKARINSLRLIPPIRSSSPCFIDYGMLPLTPIAVEKSTCTKGRDWQSIFGFNYAQALRAYETLQKSPSGKRKELPNEIDIELPYHLHRSIVGASTGDTAHPADPAAGLYWAGAWPVNSSTHHLSPPPPPVSALQAWIRHFGLVK